MRQLLSVGFVILVCCTVTAQTNELPKKSPAEFMREMRLMQFTSSVGSEKPTQEFPRVCAVLMDWPIDAGTVTVVARSTGDGSIYTTGTFGVLGGVGHESVRSAAKECVSVAQKYFRDAKPTKEYPYPKNGRVRFYLVGYDGVRVIDEDLEALKEGKGKFSDLYLAAQRVITELRLITHAQQGERR